MVVVTAGRVLDVVLAPVVVVVLAPEVVVVLALVVVVELVVVVATVVVVVVGAGFVATLTVDPRSTSTVPGATDELTCIMTAPDKYFITYKAWATLFGWYKTSVSVVLEGTVPVVTWPIFRPCEASA